MPIKLFRPANSNYIYISNLDKPATINQIDAITSYYKQGYEWSQKYQKGEWDGKVHLLKQTQKGVYKIPCGLADRVTLILRALKVKFEFMDKTPDLASTALMTHNDNPITLHDYQQHAIATLSACYAKSGVIATPTGSGKTIMALWWIHQMHQPFMVLVHRKELLYQWRDEIKKWLGIDATIIGDDSGEIQGAYNVAMLQTLASKIKRKEVSSISTGLLICDECHLVPADSFYDVVMRIKAPLRLGLSATPTRTDGAELKIQAAIGVVCTRTEVSSLVDTGHLTTPAFVLLKCSPPFVAPYASWHETYDIGIVHNLERNTMIARTAAEYVQDGRQVYIHVAHIAHGNDILGRFPASVFIHGSTPAKVRQEAIEQFKSGKIRCLISTLLREGVDIPGISCLIYACGGKSETSSIQTIGRAMRPDKQFKDAIIVDFIDDGNRILRSHTDQRIATYRKVYGENFKY